MTKLDNVKKQVKWLITTCDNITRAKKCIKRLIMLVALTIGV